MSIDDAYSHLLSPITVGRTVLRNRVVMGSIHTGLEDRTKHIPKLAAYLRERAKGGAGLIVTGGYAPSVEGWLLPAGSLMASKRMAKNHRVVTDGVHEEGGKIALQILHAGRYGYHPFVRSASTTKSPISPFKARALSARGVERTINAYVRAARLAKLAGYDGVEVMGSEGYLINQFLAARTNHRTDKWGGSASKRMRFPVEVVRRMREEVGEEFLVQYRLSSLDLVDGGQNWEEIAELAQKLELAGVDFFNTGIGWHEARIPTIVTSVPRANFVWTTAKLREVVSAPVCASNRINDPSVAEKIIANGEADLISMARPFLADPEFVNKAAEGRADEINTCIACNQACLDHTFANKRSTCLVNPRACYETELVLHPVTSSRSPRIAVVGAGVAGLACAEAAASRGLRVEVFEASHQIGGQFLLAMKVPGKEEFATTMEYFMTRLTRLNVPIKFGQRLEINDPLLAEFDQVVVATGVKPRIPRIPGIEDSKVMTYAQLLSGERQAGKRVAVIGAGGIGFDVAEYLVADPGQDTREWMKEWGVTSSSEVSGGLVKPDVEPPHREVHLMQRKSTPLGKDLNKTTGWVHRAEIKAKDVKQYRGVSYDLIDDQGLHYTDHEGKKHILDVDSIVLCTGQESVRDALGADAHIADAGEKEPRVKVPGCSMPIHIIGGADIAAELDAKRAIRQGVELAAAF